MSTPILHNCDFCGNPTRCGPADGEPLRQACVQEDAWRIAEHRRQWFARLVALSQAVDLAYKALPAPCSRRIQQAINLVITSGVVMNGNTAQVRSSAGHEPYTVNAGGCNCPDAEKADGRIGAPLVTVNGRRVPACKHQIAVWLERKINQILTPRTD